MTIRRATLAVGCTLAVVLLSFIGITLSAQPVQHTPSVGHDIDSEMQPCSYAAIQGDERLADGSVVEGCGSQCAKVTTRIVDQTRSYFNGTMTGRQVGLAVGAVGGGLLLFLGVVLMERSRKVERGSLVLLQLGGMILAFGVAALVAYGLESRVSPDLLAADRDMRSLYRLGVVPRAGQANAHCAVQLLRIVENSGSAAAKIVATYNGLFTAFQPMQIVVGTEVTRAELKARIEDMTRALEGHSIDQKISPKTAGEVFASNEILAKAREEWDPLRMLRWWWLAPLIAMAAAWSIHWLILRARDARIRRRVKAIIAAGSRPVPA